MSIQTSSRRLIAALSLLLLTALVTACGYSSRAVSVVGPPPPTLEAITLSPLASTVPLGTPVLFTATGSYSDGSKQDLTGTVAWTSSAPSVATIGSGANNAGVATPLAAGTTTITATLGTVTGSTPLTVTTTTLVSLSVTPAAATLVSGATQAFTATGTYSDGTTQNLTSAVTWHVVNPAIATVSPSRQAGAGVVTAVAAGSTAVTATLNGVTGQATLTVTAAALVSIAVTPTQPAIGVGATQQFTATGTFNNGTTQPLTGVTWVSSSTTTATISAAGLATGVAPGLTLITAADPTTAIVSPPVTLSVTPAGAILTGLTVTPAGSVIGIGGTLQFIATATFSNGTTLVVTGAAVWSSSLPTVAPVSNAAGSIGLATGAAVGQTTISATYGGISTTPQGTPDGVLLTVAGPVAYVANFNNNNGAPVPNGDSISQFAIVGGQLTSLGAALPTGANSHPYALTVDATGNFLYSANYVNFGVGAGTVSQFSIDPASGVLTPLTPASVAAGAGPNDVAAHPFRPYLYVANNTDGTISQFNIGANGALTPMAVPTVPAGAHPATIAFDPTGAYVYVVNFSGGVSQYGVGQLGGLGALPGPNAPTGAAPNFIAVHPSGKFAYVVNSNDNTISQYVINTDHTLTLMAQPTVPSGRKPWGITLDAAGKNAYVANRTDGTVGHYVINATSGVLTLADTVTGVGEPNLLTFDRTGAFAYVADRTNGSTRVTQFSVNPTTGVLTPLTPAAATVVAQPTWVVTAR